MKINHFGTSGLNPYKKQMNKYDHTNESPKKRGDKVEISSTAKEMQQLSSYAVQRQEKVAALKKQYSEGKYQVEPQHVAKSLIDYYKI